MVSWSLESYAVAAAHDGAINGNREQDTWKHADTGDQLFKGLRWQLSHTTPELVSPFSSTPMGALPFSDHFSFFITLKVNCKFEILSGPTPLSQQREYFPLSLCLSSFSFGGYFLVFVFCPLFFPDFVLSLSLYHPQVLSGIFEIWACF